MELFLILLKQLMTMAIFMVVGYCLFRTKKITKENGSALNNLLMCVVLPATLINSFLAERTPEKLKGFLISMLFTAIAMILAIGVSVAFFRKKTEAVEQFGVSFSNAGFMGIPLVNALAGAEAVFYVAPFVMLVNVLQWTLGVVIMTHDAKQVRPKKLLTIPVLYGAVIGIVLFLTQIPVPSVVRGAISSLAACNGPLAMIILGVYFAQVDIKGIFTEKKYYIVSLVRLLIIPALTGLLLFLAPAQPLMKVVIFIAAAAPIGSNVSIFANMFGCDYKSATQEVCLTTLLSIITMPVMTALFSMLFGYK